MIAAPETAAAGLCGGGRPRGARSRSARRLHKIEVAARVSQRQGPCFAARRPSEHSGASGTAGTRPRAVPAAATCCLCRRAAAARRRGRLERGWPRAGARAAAPALYRLPEGGVREHGQPLSPRCRARSRRPPLLPPPQARMKPFRAAKKRRNFRRQISCNWQYRYLTWSSSVDFSKTVCQLSTS